MKSGKVGLRVAILLLFLLSILNSWAASLTFAQTSTVTFSDVSSTYWAYAYIEAIHNAGITVGCGSGDYCPSENVTRDQMAAFIIRALYGESFTCNGGVNGASVACARTKPYFSDVIPTDPVEGTFFPYIQKLKELNITTMSGTYMPNDPVTRDEMAAFLVRAGQVKAGQGTENFIYTTTPYFTDVPASDTYFTYVQNLKDNGITTVTGTYDPDEIVPRDQMAAFIARAFLANNVLQVTVNGSTCDSSLISATSPSGGYINDPCVSVTVCTPGTSTCQTINSILLDTGSYGLRVFKQALGSVSLTPVASGSGTLAECVEYADNSSDWGPVQMADVILGNEPAVKVPIQVIDSTFGTIPSLCGPSEGYTPDTKPSDDGYNGILGVGPFVQDCGTDCATSATNSGNPTYYSCTGTTCTGVPAPLSVQVSNPVASLPADNNGLIVELPAVLPGGEPSVSGIVVLGVGTSFNNSPPNAVTTYALDGFGEFITIFNTISYSDSFIDTGSNALYFPSGSGRHHTSLLPDCQDNPGMFCPSTTSSNPDGITSLSAIIEGASGFPTNEVQFQIGNFDTLTSSINNNVFSDIGGDNPTFDWGLPFFFGSNIYIGFEGTSSSLGTGPYFAY